MVTRSNISLTLHLGAGCQGDASVSIQTPSNRWERCQASLRLQKYITPNR